MGRIAILAAGLEANETPLSQDVSRFMGMITTVSIVIGVAFGSIYWQTYEITLIYILF